MKLVRMTPGHGDLLLAEGDPELAEDEERLIEEFRRQLDLGMWAVVPHEATGGHREATMVRDFAEIPAGTERVIFFPQAAGGSHGTALTDRDREADRRARELLSSVAGEEVAAMYSDLGFLGIDREGYTYLIYAQRPVVAFDSDSGEPLNEYCVLFHDHASEDGPRLPDADDLLAKWMALHADERKLIDAANMDRPGRQMDPDQLRRDLRKFGMWKARRAA